MTWVAVIHKILLAIPVIDAVALVLMHCPYRGTPSDYYSAPVWVRNIVINPSVCVSICLSASISLEPLNRSARNFACKSPVAVARSSSGGVALRYVLPVLWMMSRLAVMGATPKGGGCTLQRLPWMAIPGRNLMFMNGCYEVETLPFLVWNAAVMY